jgi:hypothetical protein
MALVFMFKYLVMMEIYVPMILVPLPLVVFIRILVAMMEFLALLTVVIQPLDVIMPQKIFYVHQVRMSVLFLFVMQLRVVTSLISFVTITIHVHSTIVPPQVDVIFLL